MLKLYFGNSTAIISTILLGSNVACMIWGVLNHTTIKRWGSVILLFILLNGMFWYFANIRDLYSNSIVYATDRSVKDGLFSVGSVQSVLFWLASAVIWVLGLVSIFKPQHRKNIFFIITAVSIIQMTFIESSRIWVYHFSPEKFNYM